MLEFEKKIMLTQDEYNLIIKRFCECAQIQTQTNFYFDNNELSMNKKGITCRIRLKNGKYTATVKNHIDTRSDCSVEINLTEKAEFDSQIFNAFGLRYQGKLVTNRITIHKDSDCEIVLDRNEYLGHTDFELETEYSKESEEKAQKLIENIARCLGFNNGSTQVNEFLARVGQGHSKSHRFFEHLKNYK